MAPDTCPNCGAEVPRNAKACPECGSCRETGWSDQADTDALDLPNDSFDYEDYVRREFHERKMIPRGVRPVWWLTGFLLLLGWLVWMFRR